MRVASTKTNHMQNPLGFELAPATFSWKIDQTSSFAATISRVEVARDCKFVNIIHDSGYDETISNIAYTPEMLALELRTRYWWRVTVYGDKGDMAVSEPSWFETGKMDEPWTASWIVPPNESGVHPCFVKRFILKKDIASARAYACGLGVYELTVNGIKASDEYMAPGLHSYDNWLQVQTYDISPLLKPGENIIGAMLGNGWAKGRYGRGEASNNFCGEFAFIAEIHIAYASGEHCVINTGDDWLYSPSPVTDSSIYDGESYDATKEQPDWTDACFDASAWEQACVSENFQSKWGLGPLRDRLSPPVKAMAELRPVALIKTPAGENVLDMGQNMVGHIRFKCRAKRDLKLSLYFGEILLDGNFYRDNLRSAKAEYHYIANGKTSEVRPLFTFYGFRYVKLEGFEDIKTDDFTGVVLHSDMELTGCIQTSNEKVNRLFQNVLWGQRGNFLDVPTDCPQRDERFGWTGDAQIFCETAAWNMDVYAFFVKYLRDMSCGQAANGGAVPHIIPDIYRRGDGRSIGGAACGWADAATVIPWTLYKMYGDKGILRSAFPIMRAWVDWVRAEDERSGGRRLWTTGFHYGDWLAMDAPVPGGKFGATDVGFLASAYYYHSANLTAKAAEVLGDADNAGIYGRLALEIKAAIHNEYFTPGGRIAIKTQTAMVVALNFGLYPVGAKERLIESLKTLLIQDNVKLKTGFLGTPAICSVLSGNGAHPYALRLFFNEDMPGWLYPVKMGATTIWERWDSVLPDGRVNLAGMNSLNHYAYGSIASWMYRYLCGIIPLEPGFTRVRLAPRACKMLEFSRASFDSPCGDIVCGWKKLPDGKLEIEFEIPFGVTGELVLHRGALDEIRQTFPDAVEADEAVVVELTAGNNSIVYTMAKGAAFSLDTPVYDMLANEQISEMFAGNPDFKELPANIIQYTFGDFLEFAKKRFPHFADGAKAFTTAVLSIERD